MDETQDLSPPEGEGGIPGRPDPSPLPASPIEDKLAESSFEGFNEAAILKQLAAQRTSTRRLTPDQRSVDLQPGIVINRRFKVLKQLGFGGMGAVYLVKDTHLQERRALKVMLPRLLSNPQAQRRFLIETKISQKLSHENIVRVHDLGIDFDTGMQFFTMALVEGETLFRYLKARGGQLPLDEVIKIACQLCDALSYAHRYTIHRDLKPQNIMRGPGGHITVLDFGLAKLLDQSSSNLSRMAVGTIHYQAPEQKSNPLDIDSRADLYSLGVILYQLLTGKVPAGHYPPASALVKEVPRAMDQVIQRCLKPRDERYPTASALRDDLLGVEKRGFRLWIDGFFGG